MRSHAPVEVDVVALARSAVDHTGGGATLLLSMDAQIEIDVHVSSEFEHRTACRAHADLSAGRSRLRLDDRTPRLMLLLGHVPS